MLDLLAAVLHYVALGLSIVGAVFGVVWLFLVVAGFLGGSIYG